MVKNIGYIRTSKNSQQNGIEVQEQALSRYDLDQIYIEQISGRKENRAELDKALQTLRAGDSLIVYKIDRLGRSTRQLINIMSNLKEKKINVIFIKENIDTSTSYGQLVFTILSAVAELEADYISERTKEALAVLKANGVQLGNKGLDRWVESYICEKLVEGKLTRKQIALQTNVSLRTIYNVKMRNNL